MKIEQVKSVLQGRLQQAIREKEFHIAQAHVAEGVRLDCEFLLAEVEKPDSPEEIKNE